MPKPIKDQKRSPLNRSMPMRAAGQSITDEIDKIKDDKILLPLLVAGMTFVLAGMEWVRYLSDAKPSPYIFTTFALIAIAYAAYKFIQSRENIKQLKLGREGERVVANYLEDLRAHGFSVFHDVPSGDANVDHIIIGTKGIFTIETKTLQKTSRGDNNLSVKNGFIYVNGIVLPRNPLAQAKAQANWLRNFLAECKFDVKVWPVVAFPGWFVEQDGVKAENAWVIEPKQLKPKIERQSDRYSPEQVSAMVSALTSYIRFKN